METKSYTLSNGQAVTQKKLTLRQLAAIATLFAESVMSFISVSSEDQELKVSELIGKFLSNSDLGNRFFRLILSPAIADELDIMNEDAELLIGAVEDFFTFNSKLIKQLQAMLSKLDLSKLTSTLSNFAPKS